MKIEVTQADISNGMKCSENYCPIALAARRYSWLLSTKPYVNNGYMRLDNRCYNLPQVAKDFIINFDHNMPVKPFSFEV